MRTITRTSNPFAIRDKIVRIYLRKILRRFRRLNQSFLAFDEINGLSAVNACYEEVIAMTVEALKETAKKTYKWAHGDDDDFFVDLWLAGFFDAPDPVTHYKFYEEADRKRARLFEALESVTGKAEYKAQIELAIKQWSKQFEQPADDIVERILIEVYKRNGVKYGVWCTALDARVCGECAPKEGKIYPLDKVRHPPLHYNCRCFLWPVRTKDVTNNK